MLTVSTAAARRRLLHLFSTAASGETFPVAVEPATVRRLVRAGRFNEITSLIDPLKSNPRFSTEEPFAASIAIAYATAGMVDAAVSTLRSIPKPSALSLNALLSALNRSPPLYHRVPDLFNSLSKSLSITPNSNSFGILIKSHCLSRNSTAALSLLEEIESKGIEPNAVFYTTILDSLYKEKKPLDAESLWNRMINKGIKPDLAAHNVRIMNRSYAGTPESVLELMKEVKAAGLKPDIITYNYLIGCYCRHQRFTEAKQVYNNLEKNHGCVPNSKTCNDFMHALCRSEDLDGALDVCMDGIKSGKVPDMGSTKLLVDGLVKKGRVRVAKRVLSKVRHEFPANFVGGWKCMEKQLGLHAEGTAEEHHEEELLAA